MPFKKKEIFLILLFSLAIGFGASKLFRSFNDSNQNLKTPYSHMGGNFELQGVNLSFNLERFKGKNVILYFGFTHCPDVCPLSLQKLAKHYRALAKKDRLRTQVVFISVDWKRDTPESVQEYASYFHKSFLGLTGTQDQIEKIAKNYGVAFEFEEMPKSDLKFTVNHSSRFYFIGPNGKLQSAKEDTIDFKEFKDQLLNKR